MKIKIHGNGEVVKISTAYISRYNKDLYYVYLESNNKYELAEKDFSWCHSYSIKKLEYKSVNYLGDGGKCTEIKFIPETKEDLSLLDNCLTSKMNGKYSLSFFFVRSCAIENSKIIKTWR